MKLEEEKKTTAKPLRQGGPEQSLLGPSPFQKKEREPNSGGERLQDT